ncbi:flagellar motor protein MotA [Segnochrobactrum spirostomi]|uniref:Flagellar motor protein MotA n=1 Tax=Segnochrobactrum spirostomi TaxID=2608987 RepID=A0A6A7Y2R4_9HYPH|nr:flagellar motor protein MotA [Segnochrobactrum spirostomi]MQT13384.1 flagellar motor protein MotA [Segnochrobactrum spirostomi]
MARASDPYRLSRPQVFLWRMVVFLVIVACIGVVLYRSIATAFMANPGLNGLIFGVLGIGIVLAFRQVVRLFPEVAWVNSYRTGQQSIQVRRPPVLLAPMATLLGDRLGDRVLSAPALKTILDSIGTRLDEARDIARYLTGLLVFLGLLGTFWGLLQTVSSVGATIGSLDVSSQDAAVLFEDLKAGLAAPLSGMGIAFSSSLFGLSSSLILGFLDLQAGQAQNRFYTDLEDWLSSVTDIVSSGDAVPLAPPTDMREALDRLAAVVQDSASGRNATAAMANLAEGIQGLVQHLRAERQILRDWTEAQARQQDRIEKFLETLSGAVERERG